MLDIIVTIWEKITTPSEIRDKSRSGLQSLIHMFSWEYLIACVWCKVPLPQLPMGAISLTAHIYQCYLNTNCIVLSLWLKSDTSHLPQTIFPLTLPQHIGLTSKRNCSFYALLTMLSLISLCFSFKLHSHFNHETTILPPPVFNLFAKSLKFLVCSFQIVQTS